MKTATRILVLVALASLVAIAVPAWAGKYEKFCEDGGEGCVTLAAKNRASVTVIAVKVKQRGKDCPQIDTTFKGNLSGTKLSSSEREFMARDDCGYKVTFVTKGGCTGEKVAYLTPEMIQKYKRTAVLTGACGSLKTDTRDNT